MRLAVRQTSAELICWQRSRDRIPPGVTTPRLIAPYTTSALQTSNLWEQVTSYLTLTVFPVTPGQLTPGRDHTLSIFQTSDNNLFIIFIY